MRKMRWMINVKDLGMFRFSKVVSDTNESGNFIVIIGRENFKYLSHDDIGLYKFVTNSSGKDHFLIKLH